MNLETKNFFTNESRVSEEAILKHLERLPAYRSHLAEVLQNRSYKEPEASIVLPFDSTFHKEMVRLIEKKKTANIKYVVVIGIGGSSLGSEAIYNALQLSFHTEVLFANTVSSTVLRNVTKKIDQIKSIDELLLVVVSKSGSTLETVANFEYLYGHVSERFPSNLQSRTVAITDKDSLLWIEAKKLGFDVLEIPSIVGGRYSVFSAAGLFPLGLAGANVEDVMQGALDAVNASIGAGSAAEISASSLFEYMQSGVPIYNIFLFNPELKTVGLWMRQLIAESIGKDGKGILPTVSIGTADLHSVAQMYFQGPKNIFTHFMYARSSDQSGVPRNAVFEPMSKMLVGRRIDDIQSAIYEGTKKAYRDAQLPYLESILSDITWYSLGYFMQQQMITVMYLAHLMGVNAFDQPGVEAYKTAAREYLK